MSFPTCLCTSPMPIWLHLIVQSQIEQWKLNLSFLASFMKGNCCFHFTWNCILYLAAPRLPDIFCVLGNLDVLSSRSERVSESLGSWAVTMMDCVFSSLLIPVMCTCMVHIYKRSRAASTRTWYIILLYNVRTHAQLPPTRTKSTPYYSTYLEPTSSTGTTYVPVAVRTMKMFL